MFENAAPAPTGAMRPMHRAALVALFVACCASSLAVAAPAGACTIPRSLGVAFSIDDSGSMADSDPSRLRSAATGAGIDQLPDGATTAVSSFDSGARSLVDPTVVTASNRTAIKEDVDDSLTASGQTYYDLAFEQAKEQLDAMPGTDKRGLVFLSDGEPNGGDYDDELDAIRAAGIPVFTIGFFSAPGAVLAEIAASTGGQAYTVQSPGEAQAVFARIVSTLTCDAQQVQESVTLAPGETRAFPYTIGAADREFRALAAWYYGDVSVRLRRPDGSFLAPGAELAGERFISDDTYASVIGTNPAAGGWELQVTAGADNIDDVDVTVDIFRRTSADPPDAFALVSPAPGVRLPRAPVTFAWAAARNAEGYELEIDDRVVQGAISRTATSVTVDVAGAAGQHSWRVAAVNQFGRTLSERREFTLAPRAPVVLVAGLAEVNPLVRPANACAGLTDFATICAALHNAGHPVYVMPSSKGASGELELDNGGSVRPNAIKLAAFIRKELGNAPPALRSASPPLLVGHSMGGLIARTAISDYGVDAAGLFTIGTPHTGSYGADLALGIEAAPCGVLNIVICLAIKVAVAAVVVVKGANAVLDLTHSSRAAENRVLRRPAKTWVFAGTACEYPFGTSYWTPNDGIVGRSSALAYGANLGTPARTEFPLWHTIGGPLLCLTPGDGRPNEFTSEPVVGQVAAAAASFDGAAARHVLRSAPPAAAVAADLAATAAASKARTVRATLELVAARGRKLRARRPAPLPSQTTLVAAKKPFAVACGGKRLPAIRLFDAPVYAADPTLAKCSRPTVVAPIAMGVLVARDGARVRAAVTIRATRLTVVVRARRPVRMAVLRAGSGRVRVTRRRSGGRVILSARTPARKRGRLRVEAVVGGVRYSAFLPSR